MPATPRTRASRVSTFKRPEQRRADLKWRLTDHEASQRRRTGLGSLTTRERDVPALMAEGQSNGAVGAPYTAGTIESPVPGYRYARFGRRPGGTGQE
jgi:hypothetical protein